MDSLGDPCDQQEKGFPSAPAAMESAEQNEKFRSIPCQCLSDMIPDFKRVLKNIADDITELSKLIFMCDMMSLMADTKREKLTALEILCSQYQRGKFAHDNIEPLEGLLTDIDRCDLTSKHIEPYKQKYGEHTTSKGNSPQKLKSPSRSMAIQRTPSAQSLPTADLYTHNTLSPNNSMTSMTETSSKRKAHTDPSSQRNQISRMAHAKVQKQRAASAMVLDKQPLGRSRCTTVPEEESSATSQLKVGGSLQPNMVPTFQPPQHHMRASQNQLDSQTEASLSCSRSHTPCVTAKHSSFRSSTAVASGVYTPTKSGRSSLTSYTRPASSLSMSGDTQQQSSHHRSVRESMSTPGSEQRSFIVHDPDSFEESITIPPSELEESGEYSLPSLPRDLHRQSHCSALPSNLSHPCYHNHMHMGHPYGGDPEAALSTCCNPAFSEYQNSSAVRHPAAHGSCCSLPTVMQSTLYSSSAQSAFQYGLGYNGSNDHMTTPYRYRKQGASGISKPPKMHTQSFSWAVTRKSLLKGIQQHGKPLKNHVNFTLPVGCLKRKDPKVCLSVVPCENRESRHVVLEGELVIPKKCSRRKWLVEYCDCSVCLSVRVVNPYNNELLGNSCGEFDIAHSEMHRDHRTHMKLDQVLEHSTFLYNNACVEKFDFLATVQLFEHEYRLSDSMVQYECSDSDFDFTEISLLSLPSQAVSPLSDIQ